MKPAARLHTLLFATDSYYITTFYGLHLYTDTKTPTHAHARTRFKHVRENNITYPIWQITIHFIIFEDSLQLPTSFFLLHLLLIISPFFFWVYHPLFILLQQPHLYSPPPSPSVPILRIILAIDSRVCVFFFALLGLLQLLKML